MGDRGSDIYEAMVASREAGHDFLFRVVQNRDVWTSAEQKELVGVREFACSLASQGSDTVEICVTTDPYVKYNIRRSGLYLFVGQCGFSRNQPQIVPNDFDLAPTYIQGDDRLPESIGILARLFCTGRLFVMYFQAHFRENLVPRVNYLMEKQFDVG